MFLYTLKQESLGPETFARYWAIFIYVFSLSMLNNKSSLKTNFAKVSCCVTPVSIPL